MPAATTTDSGTGAKIVLLAKVTVNPPAGAAPLSATVAVVVFPPTTLLGFTDIDASAEGVIVSVAVCVVPLKDAEIVAVCCVNTTVVFAENAAEVAPAATVTDVGTVAEDKLLDNFTTRPFEGAGPLRVTVPVDETLPATVFGLRLTDVSAGGLMVSEAAFDTVPFLAVIVATVCVETGEVVMAKVA